MLRSEVAAGLQTTSRQSGRASIVLPDLPTERPLSRHTSRRSIRSGVAGIVELIPGARDLTP